ncbi:hypothetical protein CBM2606_U20001 [Cupriavidus taiwanensis]|nr:hypothetical protein CBM2606_U20001 [Cupriavidus taiwanensis]
MLNAPEVSKYRGKAVGMRPL